MSYNILIVEDDKVTAAITEKMLKELNYNLVGVCESGEHSLEVIENENVDLVLMDIGLAGKMDGIKTADQIIKKFNIPVIYATGISDEETTRRVIESSTFGYIVKPVKKTQLYTMVELTIQRFNLEKALKQRENELKKLNEQLEEKVEERTLELKNKNLMLLDEVERRKTIEEDLKIALAREKELSELKSRIVTIISHELKTPLTTILSSTQLIEFHADNHSPVEKVQKHTRSIQKSVHNLTELVNDTLFIGRAESNEFQLELKPTNINELVDGIVDQIKSGPGSLHYFKVDPCTSCPPQLMLDERLIRRILVNLISNAVKYSNPDTTIRTSTELKGNKLHLSVEDQGMGIPDKDIKDLFHMFHRASNVENIEGSGVGLAIVKKCVDFLNGKINVQSTPDKGSEFTVTFKVEKA